VPAALTVDTGAVGPHDAAVTIRAFLAREGGA